VGNRQDMRNYELAQIPLEISKDACYKPFGNLLRGRLSLFRRHNDELRLYEKKDVSGRKEFITVTKLYKGKDMHLNSASIN